MLNSYDVKAYLAPPESLRTAWKIKRDTRKRGYTDEQVLEQLRKREPDSEAFIRPQRKWADVIVSFYPPDAESEANLIFSIIQKFSHNAPTSCLLFSEP